MKILVTDAVGLIGSKLVEKLRSDGHEPLEALEGAQVVVDVSDAPARDPLPAGVAHHVLLSVVGADPVKLAREEVVKTGPVPYTILRATQCFEEIARLAGSKAAVRLPPVLVQPVAADDVASALADVALGSPLNDIVELAGPDVFRLDDLAREASAELGDRSLLPGDDARIGLTRFEDWISQSTPNHHNREELPCSPPSRPPSSTTWRSAPELTA
jgi:uncharacterized protein YbjT (DUF2867 family)